MVGAAATLEITRHGEVQVSHGPARVVLLMMRQGINKGDRLGSIMIADRITRIEEIETGEAMIDRQGETLEGAREVLLIGMVPIEAAICVSGAIKKGIRLESARMKTKGRRVALGVSKTGIFQENVLMLRMSKLNNNVLLMIERTDQDLPTVVTVLPKLEPVSNAILKAI